MIKVTFCRTGFPNAYNHKYKGAFVKSFFSISLFARFFAKANDKVWNLAVKEVDPPFTKETQRIFWDKLRSIRKED